MVLPKQRSTLWSLAFIQTKLQIRPLDYTICKAENLSYFYGTVQICSSLQLISSMYIRLYCLFADEVEVIWRMDLSIPLAVLLVQFFLSFLIKGRCKLERTDFNCLKPYKSYEDQQRLHIPILFMLCLSLIGYI